MDVFYANAFKIELLPELKKSCVVYVANSPEEKEKWLKAIRTGASTKK